MKKIPKRGLLYINLWFADHHPGLELKHHSLLGRISPGPGEVISDPSTHKPLVNFETKVTRCETLICNLNRV